MVTDDILIKSILLLHREGLNTDAVTNSKSLVRNVLDTDRKYNKKRKLGGSTEYLDELEDFVRKMIDSLTPLTDTTILESVNIICSEHDMMKSYKALERMINYEMDKKKLTRSISDLRNIITNYYQQMEIENCIRMATYEMSNPTKSMEDKRSYITNLITKLQTLNTDVVSKDPAILDEINLGVNSDVTVAMGKVKEALGQNIMMTGFKNLNKMLQGGFRRKEMWMISALQHNYKSGLLQTLFVQLMTLNKPVMADPKKKPMIIYISFEDTANVYMKFMYTYCYYNEHREMPDYEKLTPEEMSEYLSKQLTCNGYTPYTIHVDPGRWNIDKMFSKFKELESEGFEIHAIIIDYLTKLPPDGCGTNGPIGTDYREMFQRVRSFTIASNMLCITAHQMSTDAISLTRANYTGETFLKEIANKGYTELSKQIPHILDGELYLHLDRQKDATFMCLQRGKHRGAPNISEKDKFFKMKFPSFNTPMPSDLNDTEEEDVNNELSALGLV